MGELHVTVYEMLRDLRSVKIRPKERERVDGLREQFQTNGTLPFASVQWLREVCRRYGQQLNELHASRDRARRTNALRNLGITRASAAAAAQARAQDLRAENNDLGF